MNAQIIVVKNYQISNILDVGQFYVLKSDVQYCFPHILAPLCCTEMGLNLEHACLKLCRAATLKPRKIECSGFYGLATNHREVGI